MDSFNKQNIVLSCSLASPERTIVWRGRKELEKSYAMPSTRTPFQTLAREYILCLNATQESALCIKLSVWRKYRLDWLKKTHNWEKVGPWPRRKVSPPTSSSLTTDVGRTTRCLRLPFWHFKRKLLAWSSRSLFWAEVRFCKLGSSEQAEMCAKLFQMLLTSSAVCLDISNSL